MDGEPLYQNTLDYLYSFVDYSMTRSVRYSPDAFDLQRMYDLMERLGHPERGYPIIHIAGTKGKGSVSALCESVLRMAGYSTGLYTSPHLHDYAERIRLGGKSIPHEDLIKLVDEIKPIIESVDQITTFEITTALAFRYFSRQRIDAAVVEVGLGGRLDATNVVLPTVCVITSLSYDHTYLLGNTLAEIAGEKAGIIKQGVPVVLAPQQEEARQVIERIAAERSAPLTRIGLDYYYAEVSHSLNEQSFTVWRDRNQNQDDGQGNWPIRLTIPLLGHHQVENAATAYIALEKFRMSGLKIDPSAIENGFLKTSWPGRFEILQEQPLLVVDCAHNRDSALKLRSTVQEYFPGRRVILVFGASEDKDIQGMLTELMPIVDSIIVTRSFHPRAAEPEQVVEIAKQFGKPVKIVPVVADAMKEAVQDAVNDNFVLATGSIFIVASAREALLQRTGEVNAWM